MKILITSDWHLDAVTVGVRRYDDIAAAVDWTRALAEEHMVDLYAFLGDLCDPDANRAPLCVAKAIETACKLTGAFIANRWLVGNHDVIEDGSGTSTMTPIAAAGECLRDRPSFEMFPMSEPYTGAMLVWLPFTPRCATYDPAAYVRSLPNDAERVIVFGHLNVPGVVPASETHEMPRGRDVWFPTDAIREHFGGRALCFNGHYHSTNDGKKVGVGIPGTLARLTFGEQDNTPGCLLVDLDKGSAEFIPYPHARKLVTVGPEEKLWAVKKLKFDADPSTIVRLQPPADCSDSKIDEVRDYLASRVAAVKTMPAPKGGVAVVTEKIEKTPRVSTRGVIEELLTAPMTADRDKVRAIVEASMNEAGL